MTIECFKRTGKLSHDIRLGGVPRMLERIVFDPSICHGKPCIAGTRIPVHLILELTGAGQTPEQIIDTYPQLTEEDIRAAARYAAAVLEGEEVFSGGKKKRVRLTSK